MLVFAMAPSDSEHEQGELQRRTAIASALKAEGYNPSVVARKMIRDHDMDEASAVRLVSRLYGRPVSARTGDTTSAVAVGVLLMAGGSLMIWLGVSEALSLDLIDLLLFGGVVGAGLLRIVTALLRIKIPKDLGPRRPDEEQ